MTASIPSPLPSPALPSGTSPLTWTVVSAPGAALEVRTAPMPPSIREAIARALELGTKATNTTAPAEDR